MAGTVTIAGHSFKTWQVAAVSIGGLLAAYWAFKNRASSAAPAAAPSAGDGTTGNPSDPNSIDPATGLTYGEEAAGGTGYGGSGLGYGGYPNDTTPPAVTGSTYANNAAWASAVESGLTNLGWSATDVATAIGDYLAQLPLSSSQAAIVRAGLAEFGAPPVGSYSVIVSPGSSSSGKAPSEPSGLSVTPGKGYADFGWSTVKDATTYELQVVGAGGKGTGTSHVDSSESSNHAEHVALSAGRYQARVRARNSAGYSAWTGQHVFTVAKG